jgi:cell division protease FtsH
MALSDREKELTAYHEAGHALCAALLPNADPVHKVTILPRGMALGVTQQLPEEEKHSYSQEYLEESIVVAMGGRVAEELVFDHRSTGASNDLQVSTERARRMVTEFGMSEQIGPRAWGGSAPVFLGDDFGQQREFSEQTSLLIDEEVDKILRRGEDRCRELMTEHRSALDLVARALLEHETISGVEVNRLIAAANGSGTAPGLPSVPSDASAVTESTSLITDDAGAPVAAGSAPTPPPPIPPHLAAGGAAGSGPDDGPTGEGPDGPGAIEADPAQTPR